MHPAATVQVLCWWKILQWDVRLLRGRSMKSSPNKAQVRLVKHVWEITKTIWKLEIGSLSILSIGCLKYVGGLHYGKKHAESYWMLGFKVRCAHGQSQIPSIFLLPSWWTVNASSFKTCSSLFWHFYIALVTYSTWWFSTSQAAKLPGGCSNRHTVTYPSCRLPHSKPVLSHLSTGSS